MEFLQKKLFNSANFKPAAVNKGPGASAGEKALIAKLHWPGFKAQLSERQKALHEAKRGKKPSSGFMSLALAAFIALMTTGLMGFSSLSLGIKSLTRAQSHCVRANLQRQKELGALLESLLALNSPARFFHKSKQAVEAGIAAALLTGQLGLAKKLKEARRLIKKKQKLLTAKQESLLAQSHLAKKKAFQNLRARLGRLKIPHVREKSFFRLPLAVQKEKLGDQAYIYEPAADFMDQQKSEFVWRARPFAALGKNLNWILPGEGKSLVRQACAASLKKEGKRWISSLYH